MDSVDKNTGGNGTIQFQSKNINTQKSSVFDSKDKKQPFYKKHKKLLIILGCTLIVVVTGVILLFTIFIPMWTKTESVEEAQTHMATGFSPDKNSEDSIVDQVDVDASKINDGSDSNTEKIKEYYDSAVDYTIEDNDMYSARELIKNKIVFINTQQGCEETFSYVESLDLDKFSVKDRKNIYTTIIDAANECGNEEQVNKYQEMYANEN